MDSTEQYLSQLLEQIVIGRGKRSVSAGKRLSKAHSDYHAALHAPMFRFSPVWTQLAFLNYTVFFSLGVCVRILSELRALDARIQSAPADIPGRLMRPATIDAFTVRLGAGLDALGGLAFGIVSNQEPLDRIDIHFASVFDPANTRLYPQHVKKRRTGLRAAYYAGRFEKQFAAARRDLREFVRYRNKIVHTVLLPRREVRGDLHLARIDRLFRSDQRVDPIAFVRIYSGTNPVYLNSQPPAMPQFASDFQRTPVTVQLRRYHTLAVKHAGMIIQTIRRGYLELVWPTL